MADVEAVFHRLMAGLDYPMYIVTAEADGRRAGCLLGFATQCSILPVRFVVFVSKKNHTHRIALEAHFVGVHVLGPDDVDLAELFGEQTGDSVDKFEHCRWQPGAYGAPILDGCRGWFIGRVVDHLDGGDHEGFVLEPVDAAAEGTPEGLGFQALKGLEPGHEP